MNWEDFIDDEGPQIHLTSYFKEELGKEEGIKYYKNYMGRHDGKVRTRKGLNPKRGKGIKKITKREHVALKDSSGIYEGKETYWKQKGKKR